MSTAPRSSSQLSANQQQQAPRSGRQTPTSQRASANATPVKQTSSGSYAAKAANSSSSKPPTGQNTPKAQSSTPVQKQHQRTSSTGSQPQQQQQPAPVATQQQPQQQQQQKTSKQTKSQQHQQQQQASGLPHQYATRSVSQQVAKYQEEIYYERALRSQHERQLLLFEEKSAAERLEDDEAHQRRLLEMYLVAGLLREDRLVEYSRDRTSVECSCQPAVVEQLRKTAQHAAVERSVVDALRRQLEARTSAQRAEAAKAREKVDFYRQNLIRRMRQLEEHCKMVCGPEHWLLKMPDLADKQTNQPFMALSGLRLHASPSAAASVSASRDADGSSSPLPLMAASSTSTVGLDARLTHDFATRVLGPAAAHQQQQQHAQRTTSSPIPPLAPTTATPLGNTH